MGEHGGRAVMGAVLEGVKVLDLSRDMAGSFAAAYLADQGADVVKVEPPGGDPLRAHAGSRVWNRGKRSVTVDLDTPAGVEVLDRLIADRDVLIETFPPGTLEALGFDGDLPARHP